MSIAEVSEVVERFLKQANNEVLAIKGAWGVGKTHAWHALVAKHKEDVYPHSYCYVSLFGISSISDLRLAILSSSTPVSEIGQKRSIASARNNLWTSVTARASQLRRRMGGAEGGVLLKNIFVTLDAVAPSLIRDRLICLDDFERVDESKLTHDALLGFISALRDTANCKVSIILNDAQVPKDTETFQRYREKVIDKEIRFDPTVEEAISWGLASSMPYAAIVKGHVEALNIKNVRILRKVSDVVVSMQPLLSGKRDLLVKQSLASAVLLTWCYFDRTGAAPSLELIKQSNLLSTVRKRDHSAVSGEDSAEKDRWAAILSGYGFGYYDDLNEAVLKVIEQGYVEGSGLDGVLASREADSHRSDIVQRFVDAWALFHDHLSDNETELLEAMTDSMTEAARYLNPTDADAAVQLFRELGREEAADRLVSIYVGVRGPELAEVVLENHPFGRVTDRKLRDAILAKSRVTAHQITLRETVEQMTASNSWTVEQMAFLSEASAAELRDLFAGPVSVPLHKIIAFCLRFNQPPNEHVALRANEALRMFAGSSVLNDIRLRRWGISLSNKEDQDESLG